MHLPQWLHPRLSWPLLVIGFCLGLNAACTQAPDTATAPPVKETGQETGKTKTEKAGEKKPRSLPVEVVQTRLQRLSGTTMRTGTLRALHEVKVFNQEEGRIQAIYHYPDDSFRKSDLLIKLDDALLKAQLDKAVATRQQAELDHKRIRTLADKRLVAEDEQARAATALRVARAEEDLLRTRLAYTEIHAPFDGTVSARLKEPGDIAPRHTHLLTILDPTSLVTQVEVSELLLPSLKTNDSVRIRIDALRNQELEGRIRRIYPTVNPVTRQGTIEIVIERVPEQARPGLFCRVILSPPPEEYLVIPFGALRRDEKGEYVFRVEADKTARQQYVRTGIRDGNNITITEGLEAGATIITKGFLGLRDGAAVTVIKPGPAAQL